MQNNQGNKDTISKTETYGKNIRTRQIPAERIYGIIKSHETSAERNASDAFSLLLSVHFKSVDCY
jgi:hypothetical protein